jgi:hypothetical protein
MATEPDIQLAPRPDVCTAKRARLIFRLRLLRGPSGAEGDPVSQLS